MVSETIDLERWSLVILFGGCSCEMVDSNRRGNRSHRCPDRGGNSVVCAVFHRIADGSAARGEEQTALAARTRAGMSRYAES